MAAGLPVVVTDWDGFRDTVEDGVTGFRIPTLMGGNGNPIAMRYQMGADDYNAYLRGTSQAIAMLRPTVAPTISAPMSPGPEV